MAKFELVSKYAGQEELLPKRQTSGAAGYDFMVAEDTIIPPYHEQWDNIVNCAMNKYDAIEGDTFDLDTIGNIIKEAKAKPTLVPTGVKIDLPEGTYLQLSVRSSCPLKNWLILANGVGIIDPGFYGPDGAENEGHIHFMLINLSPYAIKLKRGDRIGQGCLIPYLTTDDDNASGERAGKGFGSTGNG